MQKLIEIIKELDVEVTKPNIFQAIVAKQYDMNTRFLKVTFKDGGTRIDIPYVETAKVVINAERRDGQSKGFDGVINNDGTVTVPLHSWMLELDGTVICDISVIDTASDNNKKLTTTSFTLIVEKAAYGGDDVTDDPQYDVLVSLIETCAEASAVASEALEKSYEADAKYEACVKATMEANKAAENANSVKEGIEAGGYIESLKEMNKGSTFKVWVGTNEEYEALDKNINNCLYIKTNDTTLKSILDRLSSLEAQNTKIGVVLWNQAVSAASGKTKTITVPGLSNYSLISIDEQLFTRDGDSFCWSSFDVISVEDDGYVWSCDRFTVNGDKLTLSYTLDDFCSCKKVASFGGNSTLNLAEPSLTKIVGIM